MKPFLLAPRRVAPSTFVLALTLATHSTQAAVTEAWVQHWNTGTPYGIEQPKIVCDALGNVILATSARYSAAGCDMQVVKYSRTNGAVLWQRYNNGPGPAGNSWDVPAGLAVDANGDIVVTGKSYNAIYSYDYDFYTAKYSGTNGAILWERRFNGGTVVGASSDTPAAVVFNGSGNVIVSGVSVGDFYTTKYAATNGAQIWEQRQTNPAGAGLNQVTALWLDSFGNAVVTGRSYAPSSSLDYYTAKYSGTDGSVLWEQSYDGPSSRIDYASAVSGDRFGNVLVTGYSHNGTNYDYYTAKYASTNGELLWERRYDGPINGNGSKRGEDQAMGIVVDHQENVVVVGGTDDGNNRDMYTVSYAGTDGTPIWERRYNGPGNSNDRAEVVAIDADGNFVIAGLSSKSDGTAECYTAKYAAETGAILWEKRYAGAMEAGVAHYPPRSVSLALGVDGLVVVAFPTSGSPNTRVTTVAYREIPPVIMAIQTGPGLSLVWSTNLTGFVLQSATTLANGGDWQDSNLTPVESNGQNVMAVDATNAAGFFRLRQP